MRGLSRSFAVKSALLLGTLGGCAHGRGDGSGPVGPAPFEAPCAVTLPVGPRGALVPAVDGLPPFALLDDALKRERATAPEYRLLSAADCQCLGARASSLGNLLDRKADDCAGECAGQGGGRDDGPTPAARVQQEILRDEALEARNLSAGVALELYFKLAEAEGRYDVLRQSLAVIDDALAQVKAREARGMMTGDELASLRRQRLDLLSDNIDLDLALNRLNAELQYRLNLGPRDCPWRIWPVLDMEVPDEPVNVPAAVATGLGHRPELILLRRLVHLLDPETLSTVRTVLGTVNALAGESCQGRASLCKTLLVLLGHAWASDEEVAALSRQLQGYLTERERAVASEVEQAAVTVQARLRQIGVARELVREWQRRVEELTARTERGFPTFGDRTTAHLKILEARGSLVQNVMAWYIARARLGQAQGLLAEECVGAPACPQPAHP